MEELGCNQLILILVVDVHRQSQVSPLPLANDESHVQFNPAGVGLLDHDAVECLLTV